MDTPDTQEQLEAVGWWDFLGYHSDSIHFGEYHDQSKCKRLYIINEQGSENTN